jgi:hypothetical protein
MDQSFIHSYVDLEFDSIEELFLKTFEHAYDQGWTDGLPVIPATQRFVQQFVAASGRSADELIGLIPPRHGRATVEAIAINAVMAGCRPEYMPLIIAAVEAMLDPTYPLEYMQVTTNAVTPFIVVNGPIRRKLDINSGTGCLGPGWRANSTIGRAIRLLLNNVGGALPGIYSKATFSSPLRYSYLCGENEEENRWSPFHVDLGFGPTDSTVTVFRAANYCNISGGEGVGADEILRQIATNMPPLYGGGGGDGLVLIFGINHARSLHEAGLTKRDIQQKIFEMARVPVEYFSKTYVAREQAAGRGDARTIWRARKPEEVYVFVAGGEGPQDLYIGAGAPQTRLIRMV